MSDRNKIRSAEIELAIYERALDMLERDGIEKVSMEYIRGLIADIKRVLDVRN